VEIIIDTSVAGDFRGEVSVTLGQTTAKLLVSATVKKARPGLSRLLVVETPFQKYSTGDGTAFRAWTDLVKESPLDANYLIVDRGDSILRKLDLAKFDCVFLDASALIFATLEDVKCVREYAEKGGRVVVAANHFMSDSVLHANALLAGYGMQMWDVECDTEYIGKDGVDPRLAKAGVSSLRFYRASPTTVTDTTKAKVLVPAAGTGQEGDGFVVAAKAGKGEMIALGQSLWWHWIGQEQAEGTDNAKLLRWLLVQKK
jgi:hypothetical protein